ncbi:MAG: hypothetical protein LBE27_00365 [Deltaproteobacteria bacterium]|nr:hypothetical protein [Deltaproteobacteria bacterium]
MLFPTEGLAVNASDRANYQSSPVMATGRTIPRVLMVISKDRKMFQQAYNELVDFDGDGRIDMGFNPAVVYHGYFDSKSCYQYMGNPNSYNHIFDQWGNYRPTANESIDSYFLRVGPTIDDDDQATLDRIRDSNGIASYVKAARAVDSVTTEKIGICQKGHTGQSGNFSGNWLNYVTSSKIDVLRKILYGGYRVVDEGRGLKGEQGRTVLESSYIPRDSHTWGTDVLSDDRWSSEVPLTNYYDISKYTPFPKPKAKSAHFFTRTRSGQPDNDSNPPSFPVLMYILDASTQMQITSYNADGTTSTTTTSVFGNTVAPASYGRYFNWALNEGPNPSTAYLSKAGMELIRSLNVKVEVCQAGNFGDDEGCREYPNGALKPTGLLQKNGESGQMYFGLLTGSFGESTFRSGGVMRNHINDLSDSVDPNTGVIQKNGIIYSIDTLKITGTLEHNFTDANRGNEYRSAVSWGNPSGEMLYEAVRYFARVAQKDGESPIGPTPAFLPSSEYNYNKGKNAPYLTSWRGNPTLPSEDCTKPIILFIADEDSDFDGDDMNSAGSELIRPALTDYTSAVAAELPNQFNTDYYLMKITEHEGLATSVSKRNYFFAEKYSDDCRPKPLDSLMDVKGICPNSPAFEGTYTAAAVAYYAHTHNFAKPDHEELPLDVYAVTMSANYPTLEIPVYNNNGSVAKKITIIPVSMSMRSNSTTHNRNLGFLNYYILDWQVDPRGTPYHMQVDVNFEDAAIGYDPTNTYMVNKQVYVISDWDSDVVFEYQIDLLTTSSTSTSKRNTTAFNTTGKDAAGILKVENPSTLYFSYKIPNISPDGSRFTVEPSEVVGLAVTSWKRAGNSYMDMSLGYSISGSTRDGTYMEVQHYESGVAKNATPATCNWLDGYGGSNIKQNGTGCQVASRNWNGLNKPDDFKVYRNFTFDPNPDATGVYLPNPMYLAAKYGSFNDFNYNGVPDKGEWENVDGSPRNYFQATNINQLADQLNAAFRDISRSITTGTATSATVDTVLGGGISLQTLYYPEYSNPILPSQNLRWVGSVFGLFVDKWGNLREDNDQNGVLDIENGDDGSLGDYVVTFSSKKDDPANPPACWASGRFITRCYSPTGTIELEDFSSVSMRFPDNIHQIKPVFDTGSWLANLDSEKLISKGSRAYNAAATEENSQRRIYYGKPSPNSSYVTMALYNTESATLNDLMNYTIFDNFQDPLCGPTSTGSCSVQTKAQAVKALTEWIIGKDQEYLRSRVIGDPWSNNIREVTWRLGDVINSKPIIVGTPLSNFDLLYKDLSYLEYKTSQATRRQMAYFGANDGMLHAINLGFYGSFSSGKVAFSKTLNGQKTAHELGAEVWAYIPTSLLPHLQWLPDPNYNHSYYVDLKPLVSDIKIKGEWRTVLVGGLRLGGRPIETPDPTKAGSNYYYSEIFCFDITNPENEPILLWRFTNIDSGLTVGLPNFVQNQGDWYVVIPSGPRTDIIDRNSVGDQTLIFGSNSPYNGHSTQVARLIVLRADTGQLAVDITKPENETYLIAQEPDSFFNNPFLPAAQIRVPDWNNHALYFGLTVSRDAAGLDSGAVYRLQMVEKDGTPLNVQSWRLTKFFDTDKPVTGAVNSTYDNLGNLWVLFGTGRLWSQEDVTPCPVSGDQLYQLCLENHDQYIFGVKENIDQTTGAMLFTDMSGAKLIDVSDAHVFNTGDVSGLAVQPGLTLGPGGTTKYADLAAIIKSSSVGGYKRKLASGKVFYPGEHRYEMVITQPKLITMGNGRSYMAFSSFEPMEAGCGENGYGFLYLVDTFTGLPSPDIYGAFYTGDATKPAALAEGEVAGVLTTGTGTPTEAYITASATGLTASTSAPDMSIHSITLSKSEVSAHGITSWKEVLDYGFQIKPDKMIQGLSN